MSLHRLKKLVMSNLGFDLKCLEDLAAANSDLPNLEVLDISSNNIPVEHMTLFLQKIDRAN
jgi:Leucine-rich repeat (LRR) protein